MTGGVAAPMHDVRRVGAARRPSRYVGLLWWCTGTLSLVWALALFVPWVPGYVDAGLDLSWGAAIAHGFARGLVFGRDVVFNYGPLGFLNISMYWPETDALLLVARCGLATVYWLAAFRIARPLLRPWSALPWLVAVLTLPLAFGDMEAMFLVLPVFLLLPTLEERIRLSALERTVVVVALAVGALVKPTFLIAATVALAALAVDAVWFARRFPAEPVAFALVWIACWVLAGQPVADALGYLGGSAEIAAGYTEGMSAWGPSEEPALAAVVMLALAAWWVLESRPDLHARARAPVSAVVVILFLVFKSGFVRHDGHVLRTAAAYFTLALAASALASGRPRTITRTALLGVGLLGSTALTAIVVPRYAGKPTFFADLVAAVPVATRTALDLGHRQETFREGHARVLAGIRSAFPLPPLRGSVDVYPWAAAVALAYGADYAPRPVLQSYQANSPALLERNAAFLRGPHAPATILFDVATIDHRLPSLDDGLSWPELLTRYDVVGEAPPFLVLERAAVPRRYRIEPMRLLTRRLNQRIAIPPRVRDVRDPVWAVIELKPTVGGRIGSALLKPPPVTIEVELASGERRMFRLIPAMARAGFLLSPLIDDAAGFAALAKPGGRDASRLTAARVVALTIRVERRGLPWRHYRRRVRIALARLVTSEHPG